MGKNNDPREGWWFAKARQLVRGRVRRGPGYLQATPAVLFLSHAATHYYPSKSMGGLVVWVGMLGEVEGTCMEAGVEWRAVGRRLF